MSPARRYGVGLHLGVGRGVPPLDSPLAGVAAAAPLLLDPFDPQETEEGAVPDAVPVTTTGGVGTVTLSATGLPDSLTLTDNGDGTGEIVGRSPKVSPRRRRSA